LILPYKKHSTQGVFYKKQTEIKIFISMICNIIISSYDLKQPRITDLYSS